MHIYVADLHLLEHTYFASREIGSLFESEPLIGNYALTYALNLCSAPYRLVKGDDGPSYARDLAPLNARGLYVTPAGFSSLRLALSTFNGQPDSYYYRFAQNSIMTTRDKPRAMNFPQTGRIRMLGLDSRARFYLLDRDGRIAADQDALPPVYIRLGKFMSKARVTWSHRPITPELVTQVRASVTGLLNGADLPDTGALLTYSAYNIHPAPILRDVEMRGSFWRFRQDGGDVFLPAEMEYGVE
ncbi:MAG: type I-D CRISPR-associated protein Cas5/Csc1 [Chloroflexia bacterium]